MARIQYSSRGCVRSLSSKDAFHEVGELTAATNCSLWKHRLFQDFWKMVSEHGMMW